MKKLFSILVVLILLIIATTNYATAQSANELELGLRRDFGYGGFNNDIQGVFTLKINNPPDNLAKAVFMIDSTPMGEDTTQPFSLQFNTDSYPLGAHSLSALGYTSDNVELNSNVIQVQFVAAGTGTQSILKIIVPIILLMVVIALISVFVPLVLSKGKISATPLGTPRKYGFGGGAICPRCNRPFQLRLWWINLGANKIDRCPYCGKWSFVRPRSISDLRAAEAAELASAQSGTAIAGESEAEKLMKQLDDSRYQDT